MTDGQWKIVILQRGWVVVGKCRDEGFYLMIDGARVMRRFDNGDGGLAKAAAEGPTSEGVELQPPCDMRVHQLTVIGELLCSDKWK